MIKEIRYWLEALVIKVIFFCFRSMSIDKASNIGGMIARLIGPILPVTAIARSNLAHIMPGLSPAETKKIITQMWDNLGRVFAEFPHIYNMPSEEFNRRVEIQGLDNLRFIKESKHAGIFFSAHIGNWEISPRIPREHGLPLALIYRHANNKAVDAIIDHERSKNKITTIAKGRRMAKQVIEMLQSGTALAMLVDQKMNDGIKVPFLNYDAMTAPAIAKLALQFNCPIIPAQVIRKSGAYFLIKILPPVVCEISGDQKLDIYNLMVRINTLMGEWIKENPGQWLWLHKRWGNHLEGNSNSSFPST